MIRRLLRRLAEWVTSDPSPDQVPVLLSPGRYEIPAEVEGRYGRDMLDAINASGRHRDLDGSCGVCGGCPACCEAFGHEPHDDPEEE